MTADFTLSYSSDAKYSKSLIKEYEGSDIIILNVKNPFDGWPKNGEVIKAPSDSAVWREM